MTPQETDELLRVVGRVIRNRLNDELCTVCRLEPEGDLELGRATFAAIPSGNCRTCLLDSWRCGWSETIPNTHAFGSAGERKPGPSCPAANPEGAPHMTLQETNELLRVVGKAALVASEAYSDRICETCWSSPPTPFDENQEVLEAGRAALAAILSGNCRTCLLDSWRCGWSETIPNTHTLGSAGERKPGPSCPREFKTAELAAWAAVEKQDADCRAREAKTS